MSATKRGRMRWKRDPRETGLAAVGASPRGWTYHDGVEEYAYVSPIGGGWRGPVSGWYWAAASYDERVAYKNTYNSPVATPDKAKRDAQEYVKKCLLEGGAQ